MIDLLHGPLILKSGACLIICVAITGLLYGQNPTTISVVLDPFSFGNAGQVKFKTMPSGETSSGSQVFQPQNSYETNDHKYEIFLDLDKISSDPRSSSYWFEIRVRAKNGGAGWSLFNVRADPVGKFADTLAEVTVKVQSNSGESVQNVRVPMHSAGYDDALVVVTDPERPFLKVRLADRTPPKIVLKNTLDNFSLHLTKLEVRPQCSECWAPVSAGDLSIDVSPNAELSIPLPVKPQTFSAMLASAFVLKKDAPHDILPMDIAYNIAQGGSSKQKAFKVPVRFSPPIWQLILAILVGSIVGLFLKKLLDPASPPLSKGLFAKSIFLAAVAEFLAVVAAIFDSKLVILNFDMDPRQSVPALIFAATVTGGPAVVKWAAGITQTPRAGANPGGAAGEGHD